MWNKYIDYDKVAAEMIRCHEDNIAALTSLREQLAEMGDGDAMKAIQYDADPVQTSPMADLLVNQVIQKESITERIRDLEMENRQFERAWGLLTEKERRILETFFMQGLRSEDAVAVLTQQLICDRATVYRKRVKALERFKRLMVG